jgi:hypothetical protein
LNSAATSCPARVWTFLNRLLQFSEAGADAFREFVGAALENQAVQQNDCDNSFASIRNFVASLKHAA